jgi:hypothetical protein
VCRNSQRIWLPSVPVYEAGQLGEVGVRVQLCMFDSSLYVCFLCLFNNVFISLIKNLKKFSSYKEIQRDRVQSHDLLKYGENICAFPHILEALPRI